VDREALARAGRRRQALEGLESEREREEALREELEDRVAEADGERVDERAVASMPREDAELIRSLFARPANDVVGEDPASDYGIAIDEEDALEEEIARLARELDDCRRRQRAYERYLEALERLAHGRRDA
jgi:hypothetical protein